MNCLLYTSWKTCPKCQKRMKDEHLANVDELQSYLIHRIEKFLNNHGRHLLGWDEILLDRMDFIQEQNDITCCLYLLDQTLHTLFKLSTVF